jgi:hypothetical protein
MEKGGEGNGPATRLPTELTAETSASVTVAQPSVWPNAAGTHVGRN